MKIKNSNNPDDVVSVEEPDNKEKGEVYLKIGLEKASRHANLRPTEARAIAYALLYYAEQSSK